MPRTWAACGQPPWAGKAKVFEPLTAEMLAEAEITLTYDHIVTLASEVDQVKASLRELNCKGIGPSSQQLMCRQKANAVVVGMISFPVC